MSLLFGPADDAVFTDRWLRAPLDDRRWALFGARTPSWDAAVSNAKGAVDALVLWLGYARSCPAAGGR